MTNYERAWVWTLAVLNVIFFLGLSAAFERFEARLLEVEGRPAQTVVIERQSANLCVAAAPGAARREPEPEPVIESAEFTAYAYCGCEKCCGKWAETGLTASGTVPAEGRTIAVDPAVIPLGTAVLVDGAEYIAEDTGGGIRGNVIDIYMDSHEAALLWGKRTVMVSWEG